MKQVTIEMDDFLYLFYQKVGENAGGQSAEQVMLDSLFKLAGLLAQNARETEELLHSTTTTH